MSNRRLRVACIVVVGMAMLVGCAPSGASPGSGLPSKVMTPYMSRPTSALGAEEYRSAVNDVAKTVNTSLADFNQGLNSRDINRTIQALARLTEARDAAAGLAPPPELARVHEQLMSGLDGYSRFAQTLTQVYTQEADESEEGAMVEEAKRTLGESGRVFNGALEDLGL